MVEKQPIETLSDIIAWTKYARYSAEDKRREVPEETIARNEAMHLQKFAGTGLEDEIKRVYRDFVYTKKIVPSMRSFQFAGEPILREGGAQRIYNCSYAPVTAPDVWREFSLLLLSGVGVGYSVQRHHVEQLPTIKPRSGVRTHVIDDSIEGWAMAFDALVNSFFDGTERVRFDYSQIRQKGALIYTSGGRAPGSEPLKNSIDQIEGLLTSIVSERGETQMKPIEVHDSICLVAEAVLSGGIRRSALISLFSPDDQEMMNAKSVDIKWWEFAPYRARANNSVVFDRKTTERPAFENMWETVKNSGTGEPGLFWTHDLDIGTNPCGEISLIPHYDENGNIDGGEFCNLTEVNAATVTSQEDLNERVEAATLLGTLQASYDDLSSLLRPGWKNQIQESRLLGVSMTGIAAGRVLDLDLKEASRAAKDENARVADIIGINHAHRITTVKPSGTSSLWLSGSHSPVTGEPEYVSSGIHAYHAPYILRRVRLNKGEAMYKYIAENHPSMVEDEAFDPENTAVITFPIKSPEGAITRDEAIENMLERVRRFNVDWIGEGHRKGANRNNVSVTISIRELTRKQRIANFFKSIVNFFGANLDTRDEWRKTADWLWENRALYGGISVLPASDAWYPQLPFEETDKETYDRLVESMEAIDISQIVEEEDHTNLQGELACIAGNCEVTDISSDENEEEKPVFEFQTIAS